MPKEEQENSSYDPVKVHTGGKLGIRNLVIMGNHYSNDKILMNKVVSHPAKVPDFWYQSTYKPIANGTSDLTFFSLGWISEFKGIVPKVVHPIGNSHGALPDILSKAGIQSSNGAYKFYFKPEIKTTKSTSNFEPLNPIDQSFIMQANKLPTESAKELNDDLLGDHDHAYVSLDHFILDLGYASPDNIGNAFGNVQNSTDITKELSSEIISTTPIPVGSLQEDKMDIHFNVQCPMSPLESTYVGSNVPKLITAEIKNETSYNNPIWSEYSQTVHELFLPNFYVYLTRYLDRDEKPSPEKGVDTTFKLLLHQGLLGEAADSLLFSKNKDHAAWAFEKQTKQQTYGNSSAPDYFETLAKETAFTTKTGIHDLQKNIIFTTDNLDMLNYSEHANIFPTHNKIEFDRDKESPVAKALYDTGLEKFVLTHIAFSDDSITKPGSTDAPPILQPGAPGFGVQFYKNTGTKTYKKYTLEQPTANNPSTMMESQHTNYGIQYEMADLSLIMDVYKHHESIHPLVQDLVAGNIPDDLLNNNIENILFPGTGWKENIDDFDDFNFEKSLKALIFESAIAGMAKKHFRSLEEVYAGKECHSETIAYKIEKYLVPQQEGQQKQLIQSFYFPNSGDLERFVYCDTQITFGELYSYEIYAYRVVFGNKYKYLDETTTPFVNYPVIGTDLQQDQTAAGKIFQKIKYHNKLHLALVKVPYYGFHNQLQDKIGTQNLPPLPPQVTFLPYRNVNDKMMIRLETNHGEHMDNPITIKDEDEQIFADVRETQNVFSNSPIKFKTDSPVEAYEIFRIGPDPETGLTEAPQSYADFVGKEYELVTPKSVPYMVSPDAKGQDPQTVYRPSPSVVMGATTNFNLNNVLPNRTYYYTFRTKEIINDKGVISNPTAVYKVELVSEPGKKLGIPRISIYDMKTKKKRNHLKTVQRFLKISPALNKSVVVSEEYDPTTSTSPELGTTQAKLFAGSDQDSKKFKIRLTSKSTGKKIDVNVKFEHNHTNGPPYKK